MVDKKKDLTQAGRKPTDPDVTPQDPMADHPGGDVDSEPTGAGPSGTTTTGDSEPTGSGPSGGA